MVIKICRHRAPQDIVTVEINAKISKINAKISKAHNFEATHSCSGKDAVSLSKQKQFGNYFKQKRKHKEEEKTTFTLSPRFPSFQLAPACFVSPRPQLHYPHSLAFSLGVVGPPTILLLQPRPTETPFEVWPVSLASSLACCCVKCLLQADWPQREGFEAWREPSLASSSASWWHQIRIPLH